MTLYSLSVLISISLLNTAAAGTSKQKLTVRQLDIIELIQREEAAAHQNKNTFQFSLSSFHGIAGRPPPLEIREAECADPALCR